MRRDASHETSKEHRQQAGLEPALQSPRQGLSITWAAGQQVLCPSSHGESQIPDPRDFLPSCLLRERSVKFIPSCQVLGFCPASVAQDELRGAHPTGFTSSYLPPRAASLLSPLHPPHLVSQLGPDSWLETLSHYLLQTCQNYLRGDVEMGGCNR